MKMKKIKVLMLSLSLALIGGLSFAQNGLESVIVERYYTANAADASGSIGALPAGSVTYRVYADMLPNYKFEAIYGVAAHNLTISTTTNFFNNEDRGAVTPNTIGSQYYVNNSVALDSWFSVGAAANGQVGVLKSEDNGAANLIAANTMLQNNDGDDGIPLTTQDGMIAGTNQSVTFVGITSTQQNVFNGTSNAGNILTTNNGSIASLSGSYGAFPTTTNRVLIGQFTTDGHFHFNLNVQIGTPSGGTQNYVASSPTGNEISIPSLTFDSYIAPPTATSPITYCTGATASALTATAISGDTLRWYTAATGGTGSLTAPTPSTTTAGTTTYYVSQYKGSSLSPRTAVNVIVNQTPTVTANSTSICLGATATLTATGATAYNWSQGGTTASVTASPTATTTYTVTGTTGGCSSTATSTVTVTVSVATPGTITGTAAVCAYVGTSTAMNYHITAVVGATSYNWTVPTGAVVTSGQGTTSINVSYAGVAQGAGALGNVAVVAVSAAGCQSLAKTLAISATLPTVPTTCTGTAAVCAYVGTLTSLTYTTTGGTGALTHIWTVPAGVNIVSGQGTASLVVNYAGVSGTGALGNITVAGVSGCGTGPAKTLAITLTAPATPGVVTGPLAVCNYVGTTTPVTYSIVAVAGAASYTWTVPTGVTILSGQGTTAISVDFHTLASGAGTVGVLTVISNAACGSSAVRSITLTKTAVTAQTAVVGQLNNVCSATNYTYTCAVNANALSYLWTVPAGATIVSGQGTTSMVVNFPAGYVTGAITVANVSGCSTSAAKSITVVSAAPLPGVITGTTVVCPAIQAQTTLTYSIVPVAGVSSYLWTAPANASIASGQGTTSVTVSFASNFATGNLSVVSVGNCVNSAAKTLALTKLAAEPGTITGSTSICTEVAGGIPVSYSVVAINGATSYTWTLPANATILSGAGTNSVSVLFDVATPTGSFVKVASVDACGTSLARSSAALSTCASPITMTQATTNVTNNITDIYPNPSSDFINFDVTADVDKDIIVEVYNLLGAKLISKQYSIVAGVATVKTDVSSLNNGVFMVRITDLSNNTSVTKSMVK